MALQVLINFQRGIKHVHEQLGQLASRAGPILVLTYQPSYSIMTCDATLLFSGVTFTHDAWSLPFVDLMDIHHDQKRRSRSRVSVPWTKKKHIIPGATSPVPVNEQPQHGRIFRLTREGALMSNIMCCQ